MSGKKQVKTELDQNKCISCGVCGSVFPQAFVFDESTGKYKVQTPYGDWIQVDQETYQKLKMAEQACPVRCITVYEKT